MSDVQNMRKLPDTMVSVSYWALDSLLDWAEMTLAHCDDLPYRISDEQIEQLREWQAAGDEEVYGEVARVELFIPADAPDDCRLICLPEEPSWEELKAAKNAFVAEGKFALTIDALRAALIAARKAGTP